MVAQGLGSCVNGFPYSMDAPSKERRIIIFVVHARRRSWSKRTAFEGSFFSQECIDDFATTLEDNRTENRSLPMFS